MEGGAMGAPHGATSEYAQHQHLIVQQAAVGILELDTAGNFVRANPRFCRIFGFDELEIAGWPYQALIFPDNRAKEMEALRRLIAGEIQDYAGEVHYLRRRGGSVWVSMTAEIGRAHV
jgi:PAS domain S-box-containing protein